MGNIIITSGPMSLQLAAPESNRLGRNGTLTDGPSMGQLAAFLNTMARRCHVLAHGGTACFPFPTVAPLAACRFHTSANCAGVELVMALGPSLNSTRLGKITWTVGGVAQTPIYSGGLASATGPNDISYHRLRVLNGSGADLAPDSFFNAEISSSNSSILSWTIFEIPRSAIDTALHSSAHFGADVFAHGAPILDRDVAKLTDMAWELYRRQGPVQLCWSCMGGALPTQTGATYKNVLDGATTGYASTAAGFWTIPYRKNRLAGTTVDVKFWASASTNAGAGGRVRFSNSTGVLATITGFTTGARQTIEATGTLDATISTSDLVIVEHSDSAGNTITTAAAGIYEYLS